MKNDLGLSKGLLNSVSSLLNDSSKLKAEEAKADRERLATHIKSGSMRPLSMEDAKVASYAAKAPERRVNDTITQLYTQSVAEHNAKAQAEATAIKTAYGKMGGVAPFAEAKELSPKQKKIAAVAGDKNAIDAMDFAVLRNRKKAQAGSVSDEKILDGEPIKEEEEDHDTISYPLSKDSFKDGMKYASGTSGTVHNSKTHHVKETEAGVSSTDANIVYGIHDKATGKIHGVSISAFNKTTPEKVAKATGSSTVNAAHKALAAHHNETTYVGEERDTPGNSTHQCAIHVKHATMGEGRTLTSQHAQPDTEGQISWYAVMFEHGIEKVETKDLEILESEWHNQHPYSKSSKKMGIKPKK